MGMMKIGMMMMMTKMTTRIFDDANDDDATKDGEDDCGVRG